MEVAVWRFVNSSMPSFIGVGVFLEQRIEVVGDKMYHTLLERFCCDLMNQI